MFPLSADRSVRDGADGPRPSGFVLPRWLRRPMRLLARLARGQIEPPRFAGLAASTLVIAGFAGGGAYLGGHVPAIMQAVSARTGLAVDAIRVTGNRETSELDVLDRLGLDGWTALVGYSADAARERIASLPWVESAAVRKIYPNTLEVDLSEKTPFALWQREGELSVIQADGKVIAQFAGGRLARLPLLVGGSDPQQAVAFISGLQATPELSGRIKGYVRVADRRWDLRLDNGITVKLPESGDAAAIADLLALDRSDGLLSRDISVVDMRFPDRLIVELTPGATERREAALKEEARVAKKAGRRT